MSVLTNTWDSLPQSFRDAVGRFVKVIGAAATAAGIAYVVGAFRHGSSVSAAELWTAISVAALSAVEKFFGVAPKVSAKLRKK